MKFSAKYKPLWEPQTRIIVLTGGRASGKSTALSGATLDHTYRDPYNILYARWNLTSAEISIIPEFKEKMDLLNCSDAFIAHRADVENISTGSRIWFRGLQQSSKNQIAKLKSIARLKMFVLDEAQELMNENTFDTIDDSIREKDAPNLDILSLNPTDVNHWIYRRFFREAGVKPGFNGVHEDVTYIHTTYLDNLQNLSKSFLEKIERIKEQNPTKYAHEYLGEWSLRKEGLIYPNWRRISPAEYPTGLKQWWANDWGFSNDPNALARMCMDPVTRIIYVWPVAYRTGMQPRDVAKAVIEDGLRFGYSPSQCLIYCDPARPEHIRELRTSFGLSALPAINKDKTGRIGWLQGFEVCYVGDEIEQEVQTYSWKPNPNDETTFTDVPQDGNDHFMDCINYGAVSHLRRNGISS